jgi:hypothetical protein
LEELKRVEMECEVRKVVPAIPCTLFVSLDVMQDEKTSILEFSGILNPFSV